MVEIEKGLWMQELCFTKYLQILEILLTKSITKMNVTTVSKRAKHQSIYTYTEICNDEFCSCDSHDYEILSFYNEKGEKLLNHLEMKTKSAKKLNKTNFASKVLPIYPKGIHGYKTFNFMVLGAANVGNTSLIERFIHVQFTDDH